MRTTIKTKVKRALHELGLTCVYSRKCGCYHVSDGAMDWDVYFPDSDDNCFELHQLVLIGDGEFDFEKEEIEDSLDVLDDLGIKFQIVKYPDDEDAMSVKRAFHWDTVDPQKLWIELDKFNEDYHFLIFNTKLMRDPFGESADYSK